MNFPSFENFTMRALELPPCPSATKISPFEATTSTALVAPQVLPSGIFAQFSMVRYGLGAEFVGWTLVWPYALSPTGATVATMAAARVNAIRQACDITDLLIWNSKNLSS